ncbi:PIN-like domain-containing protein [Streptomyces sp. NPDC090135]|uniref:PIN-like domain-containing protein n=1 Tax=Streptomyces sp. NPDC090135 TaxID=3365957 RepID=UPI00381FC101
MEHEEQTQASDSGSAVPRGIFDGFSGYVTPTEEDWRNVLRSGLVVVDTNVLLNLYRYNQETREAFLETLQRLGTCLWVPHQVMEEFWRNRENAIADPRKQLNTSEAALRKDLQKTIDDLRSWTNRVSLDQSRIDELESTLSNAFNKIIAVMAEVVNDGEEEMSRDTSRDKVIAALGQLLHGKVGDKLNLKDHAEAVAEGKRRIQDQIPPGYKDKAKASRGDDSEVGDYLVWLQIVREAEERSADVLLVTGDTKEDWWRTHNNVPVGPRNELAEELRQEAGTRLYMLKPDKFLSYARDFLQVEVTEDSVQNVEMVDAQSTSDASFRTLEEMVEREPTRAFEGAWDQVEEALVKFVSDGNLGQQRMTMNMLLSSMESQYGVSAHTAANVRQLQNIRNSLAHESNFHLTEEGARTLISTAKEVVSALALISAPRTQAMRFEQSILESLNRGDFPVFRQNRNDFQADFLVRNVPDSDSCVAIEVKFTSNGVFSDRRLREEMGKLVLMPEDMKSLLVVTNGSLAPHVQQFNSSAHGAAKLGGRRLEIVQWRTPDDDPSLHRALAELMREAASD